LSNYQLYDFFKCLSNWITKKLQIFWLKKNSFQIILDLLFIYRNNTVFHNQILEYFTTGLSRVQYALSIINSSQLINRILNDWDQLVQLNDSRIKDPLQYEHAFSWLKKLFRNFKNNNIFSVEIAVKMQIIRGSSSWGCFGHLLKLANFLVNLFAQMPPEIAQSDAWRGVIENESWKKFVDEELKVYNAISSQKLDQDLSSESSDDDNEDQ